MTKVLVSGASGFIGKHLIPKLHNHQYNIVEMNRSDGDVADEETWSQVEPADILVHLAGITFVPDSWSNPKAFLKTNFYGTVCALDYCRKHNAKLIYLSSYLYGNPSNLPISEFAPLSAVNPYALSKKMAEDACIFYAEHFGVKITIFRPFNVYGSGQASHFLIPSIVSQVLKAKTIHVKDLEPKRDYIYINDLIDIIIRSLNSDQNCNIFNVGTGVSYSVAELISLIQTVCQTNLLVQSDKERRLEEIMDTQADINKAQKVLGWNPQWSLISGLADMLRTP